MTSCEVKCFYRLTYPTLRLRREREVYHKCCLRQQEMCNNQEDEESSEIAEYSENAEVGVLSRAPTVGGEMIICCVI